MTQTPMASGSGGVPAHRPAPSRQQTAAMLLKRIRENHLSLSKSWADMVGEFKAKKDHASGQAGFLFPPSIRVRQPSSEEDRKRQADFLMEQSALQPDPAEARSLLDRIYAVADGGFHAAEARVAIALMIDAYPNARPHSPEAYIASIMDVLEGDGFPTAAVSIACHELKTESTFLPALAEVVEKVKTAARSLGHQQQFLTRYLDWDQRSTAALEWLTAAEVQPNRDQRADFPGNDPF